MKFLKFLFAFSFALLAMPTSALAASLSLSPSTGTFNKNCSFSLNMVLDTAGAQTDGTDAILMYDTTRLSANSIVSGTIYPDYPGNNINESTGKITISGLASVATAFSGQGTLATIGFTVKGTAPVGITQVNFDFDPNDKAKTTDSNVVERGTIVDVLNSVVNGSYTVGSGTCGAQTGTGTGTGTGTTGTTGPGTVTTGGTTVTPISTPSGQYKTLPQAGTQNFTATIAILGVALTLLGILGLALL